ncbi:CD2 antigen cytoplasmic tail-binding protein 2-like [Centruroides sculpturatus]|uniref:CD2 antigen cytoplasmic tail-binding protein 2-like n=1 Tax=Centruroides sculpturatus TaxID=218467 RepID=UPI000C6D915A|nr:CD2 antigen cytoplasmic tail-binding protein 2-like [Centruroides sculpturatus]
MSKREEQLEDSDDEYIDKDYLNCKRFKNSLDSDEEDDEEKCKKEDVLDPDELEGQEDATIDYDEGIKITPFNMAEELEEGYFDKEGTFIFKKENQIKDNWLDNIDWVKLLTVNKLSVREAASTLPIAVSPATVWRCMHNHKNAKFTKMTAKPKLTQLHKIARLNHYWHDLRKNEEVRMSRQQGGGSVMVWTGFGWGGKTDIVFIEGQEDATIDYDEGIKITPFNMAEELEEGYFDKEGTFIFKKENQIKDNWIDNIDWVKNIFLILIDDEVMWEFKWENEENAAIYGPHPSSEMLRWVEEGYFEKGVWVRKVGQNSDFYNSRRIDFDLYV